MLLNEDVAKDVITLKTDVKGVSNIGMIYYRCSACNIEKKKSPFILCF